MSTSSSPARVAKTDPDVRPFSYAEVSGGSNAPSATAALSKEAISSDDQRVHQEAIREQGRKDRIAQAKTEYEAQLAQLRGNIRDALLNFARERAAYYQQVETEIVQLALSIARKILHRESQVDPLVLAGMVHVALDQIERGTKTTIRVNPRQVSEFRTYFAHHMEAQDAPEVLEDNTVARECCVLQTSLGTTQVGVDVQLKEIEQGLSDLMARKPGVDR